MLCVNGRDPLEKCLVAYSFALLPLFFCTLLDLVLLASLALMIDGLASEAVRNLAPWAVMTHDFILLAKTEIVTVICGALEVVARLSIPDHLPLMTSPSDQFIVMKKEKHFEVGVS